MKKTTLKITTMVASVALAAAVLCSCTTSKIEKARQFFISRSYEATEITEGDYPSFNALGENGLPLFSYIDCKESDVALGLFEEDKELITSQAEGNVELINRKNAVVFNGVSADGVHFKVAATDSELLFATYEKEHTEQVDEAFEKLGFN